MQRFVERLGIDCDRLLHERLWKLYGEGQFGRLRGEQGGAVEYSAAIALFPITARFRSLMSELRRIFWRFPTGEHSDEGVQPWRTSSVK